MKRQQINLLNPELFSTRDWLDLRIFTIVFSVCLTLLVFTFFGLRYHVKDLQTQQQAQQAELARIKTQLDTALAMRVPQPADPKLLSEIAEVEQKTAAYRLMLNFLKNNNFEHSKGPSAYFEALSNRTLSGLWLKRVAIQDSVGKFELEGETLATNLIPSYIESLGKESVLQGREFATLTSTSMMLTQNELTQKIAPSQKGEQPKTNQDQPKYQLSQFVLQAKQRKEDSALSKLTQGAEHE